MAITTFNTNIAAFGAQRNIKLSSAATQSSLSKLSSGLRVPTAKDDAAALAIGSNLRAEVAGLKQASVNAGQATSLLQIAEGAMSQVGEILVRMKTLAVQASSGQLSNNDRSTLDAEFQALVSEIDRIAGDAEFNGTKLVGGSVKLVADTNNLGNNAASPNLIDSSTGFAGFEFDEELIGVGTGGTAAGGTYNDAAFSFRYDATSDIMTARNLETGAEQSIALGNTAIPVNTTQEVNFNSLGVKVTLNSNFSKSTNIGLDAVNTSTLAGATVGAIEAGSVRLLSVNPAETTNPAATPFNFGRINEGTLALTAGSTAAAAVFEVAQDGVTFTGAAVNLTTTGTKTVTLSDADGNSFSFEFNVTTAFDGGAGTLTGNIELSQLGTVVAADQTDIANSTFDFKVGTGVVAAEDTISFSIGAVSSSGLSLAGQSISTQGGADTAIGAVNTAINTLSGIRADVGAAQSRLEFASNNLAVSIENSEAARSALLDVDVAEEITNFTTKQVLLQAGVSMLAQANQLPQNLLQLLQ